MGYLIDILIGFVSRVVTAELIAHTEPMARWIIGKAVERLPADVRERFREEWTAHLNETPGSFRKLLHAIGCLLAASALANIPAQHAGGTAQTTEDERHYRCFLEITGKADPELSAKDREFARLLPWDDLSAGQLRQIANALVEAVNAEVGFSVTISLEPPIKVRRRKARST
jgi:hypothetical protein